MDQPQLAAIITGFAGIIAAVGGVLLTIRKVKSQERDASQEELAKVEGWLAEERDRRIELERDLFDSNLRLSQHGIEPPGREGA